MHPIGPMPLVVQTHARLAGSVVVFELLTGLPKMSWNPIAPIHTLHRALSQVKNRSGAHQLLWQPCCPATRLRQQCRCGPATPAFPRPSLSHMASSAICYFTPTLFYTIRAVCTLFPTPVGCLFCMSRLPSLIATMTAAQS